MGDLFHLLFTYPITNLLVAIYQLFSKIGIPFALGFSIVGLTALIRLILYPLSAAQIKSATKMQKVSPHLARIRDKHKDDKKRQQEEMMKLYKEHGINPASGCLPILVQIPVLWSLYSVLTTVVAANSVKALEKINEILYATSLHVTRLWDTTFFGLGLADVPSQIIGKAPLIALVPVLTGILQFILSKMMMPQHVEPAKKEKGKEKEPDFQTMFQTQSLFIFPIMIGFFSFSLPIGLSLYWNTFTLFGILQQYQLAGLGGLDPWLKRFRYGR